jgi:hypothetical protein
MPFGKQYNRVEIMSMCFLYKAVKVKKLYETVEINSMNPDVSEKTKVI